jgi:hypothetical protein
LGVAINHRPPLGFLLKNHIGIISKNIKYLTHLLEKIMLDLRETGVPIPCQERQLSLERQNRRYDLDSLNFQGVDKFRTIAYMGLMASTCLFRPPGIFRYGGSWHRIPRANRKSPGKGGSLRGDESLPVVYREILM